VDACFSYGTAALADNPALSELQVQVPGPGIALIQKKRDPRPSFHSQHDRFLRVACASARAGHIVQTFLKNLFDKCPHDAGMVKSATTYFQ